MENPSSPTYSTRKRKLSLLQLRKLKQLLLPYGMDIHLWHVQILPQILGKFLKKW